MEVLSPSCFGIVARTHARLLYSFFNSNFSSIGWTWNGVYKAECWQCG